MVPSRKFENYFYFNCVYTFNSLNDLLMKNSTTPGDPAASSRDRNYYLYHLRLKMRL